MFTGIIETLGTIKKIVKDQDNIHLTIKSEFTHELKIDQSVAHNGVCLTVINIENNEYTVTAIKETLDKTTIGHLSESSFVNLERGMKLGDRLDGHIVQGHVDQTATCIKVKKEKYESSRYRHDDEGNYQRVPYQATRTTIERGDNE